MARNKVKRFAAVAVVAAGVFGGSVVAATSASASDPWNGDQQVVFCPNEPNYTDWLSISNPTHCDRIIGTFHDYDGVYGGMVVNYIDATYVENNITYADNEVSWCQADLYSGRYGTGSVLHRAALTSGNATGYAESLGWNC